MKLYKCMHCGNVVEKVLDKGVPVVCCGEPMVELVANTTDAATEKHVPVLSIEAHPMTEEHLITAIFAVVGNKVLRADLTADDEPVATFALGGYKGTVEVYEYCNLHGLWKAEIEA